MEYTKDLSIVISLFNEEESLPELIQWIEGVMKKEGYTYEIIMVDDGSRDASWKVIKDLSERDRFVCFHNNPSYTSFSLQRHKTSFPSF